MRRTPRGTGLVAVAGLAAAAHLCSGPLARAQFGLGDDATDGGDGGDGGGGMFAPRKYFTNPWRVEAGPDTDSGYEAMFRGYGGSSYLRDRAPHLADLMDSDGGFMPAGGDGGGSTAMDFDFDLPSFGADLDAGVRDAGPVQAPQFRVALPRDWASPLTTLAVPHAARWVALPAAMQQPLADLLGSLNPSTLTRAQRRNLWRPVHADPLWRPRRGFMVGSTGTPAPAHLVAVGYRLVDGRARFYGAFVTPRDGRSLTDAHAVLAATANAGPYAVPQPARPPLNPRFHKGVERLAVATEPPAGWPGPLRAGRVHAVVVRVKDGYRVEALVEQAGDVHGQPRMCLQLQLDGKGHLLKVQPWSPVCEPLPVAAVDVDGDGMDEVVWRSSQQWWLQRYPQGAVLDQDPPAKEQPQ